ncbi:D-3-phosphoglycerate dehydrogenase SerA [Afipia carboxidovorans OM5]|uniref:D-3-phosphoglycerate dehydrogenase SerA n=1 Tax=Afipia carboxidovorans (strain ATCC 49405 / DSM 1227 / KCTC 32145 / OM5) TaxID=504832 RepID=F8BWW0_AFIC5|nr:hydroxyacid dehydrogenase [Afipia carboxidovorans]AEI01737.1 D-3-phosphoglycerate dehydrogenase SerA [Afipia carboxidovorans OM4]AEI05312.1 D-3-phosphoglycerate dehydrogenase SerA [Afipia carboxidovorans OM5]
MILITEFMDEDAIRDGLAGFDVRYDPTLVDQPQALLEAVREARALIVRNRTQVRGDVLAAATKLEVIGRLGVGLDNIDVEACRARNIKVYPASGANDVSVAEYVIATAMVLLRGAYQATPELVAGQWPRNRLVGREISGKCLGLIGFGSIARETAQRAAALGMTVVAFDPYVAADAPVWTQPWGKVQSLDLAKLLAAADVMSLHVPLTPETRSMIDAKAIAGMKNDAVIINAARGGVVDEAAVAAALKAGKLGGAALDVFDKEPIGNSGAVFADAPNLILTPHIAGVTVESNVRVSRVTVDNVARHLKGA